MTDYRMERHVVLAMIACASVAVSCSEDVLSSINGLEVEKTVYFSAPDDYSGTAAATRAATNADATTLSDVWVVQFNSRTGKFKNAQYSKIQLADDGAAYAKLKLSSDELGDGSNLYYLVNSHDEGMLSYYPETESAFLSNSILNRTINGAHWCDTLGVPMYARSLNKEVITSNNTISLNDTVKLKRLCSKINLKIRAAYYGDKDFVNISKVTLRGVPSSFNYLEQDTANMSAVELMDYSVEKWDGASQSVYEETGEDGTKYHCRDFSWYVPYSYPTDLSRRMYVDAWAEFEGDYSLFTFRVHDSKGGYEVRSNTIYSYTETLVGTASSGSEEGTFQVVNFDNVSLSSSGDVQAANSYVCSTKLGNTKYFCFPIKQYNVYASKFGSVDGVKPIGEDDSWTAEKLWSTNADKMNVDIIGCTGEGEGYVYVKVTPAEGVTDASQVYGNALIAIRDAEGNILWSWHLWIHPQNVLGDTYEYGGYTWLGRSLGAYTSGVIGENNPATSMTANWKETLGLYYQWGRKDPFRGLYGKGIADEGLAATEGQSAYTSKSYDGAILSNATVAAARTSSIANPLSFYVNNAWTGCGDENNDAANSWCNADGSKSVFDPCPPGFRVAPQEAYASFGLSNFVSTGQWETKTTYTDDGTVAPYRVLTSEAGKSIYFTAGGRRMSQSGVVSNIGSNGMCWTSNALTASSSAGYLLFTSSNVMGNTSMNTGNAIGIRAVKE